MMTPMIDVVFLLLIFFVATASIRISEQILPSYLILSGTGDSKTEVEPELQDLGKIVIKILWHGDRPSWTVNGQPYTSLPQVRQVLEQIATEVDKRLPVIIDPQREVYLEHVINLYDRCRLIGFSKIQFAASTDV